jgi:hypothetical protein
MAVKLSSSQAPYTVGTIAKSQFGQIWCPSVDPKVLRDSGTKANPIRLYRLRKKSLLQVERGPQRLNRLLKKPLALRVRPLGPYVTTVESMRLQPLRAAISLNIDFFSNL